MKCDLDEMSSGEALATSARFFGANEWARRARSALLTLPELRKVEPLQVGMQDGDEIRAHVDVGRPAVVFRAYAADGGSDFDVAMRAGRYAEMKLHGKLLTCATSLADSENAMSLLADFVGRRGEAHSAIAADMLEIARELREGLGGVDLDDSLFPRARFGAWLDCDRRWYPAKPLGRLVALGLPLRVGAEPSQVFLEEATPGRGSTLAVAPREACRSLATQLCRYVAQTYGPHVDAARGRLRDLGEE